VNYDEDIILLQKFIIRYEASPVFANFVQFIIHNTDTFDPAYINSGINLQLEDLETLFDTFMTE
jgi:hypothetical protein